MVKTFIKFTLFFLFFFSIASSANSTNQINYYFSNGSVTLSGAGSDDLLFFKNDSSGNFNHQNISYLKERDDLIISAGNGSTITISNHFTDNISRFERLFFTGGVTIDLSQSNILVVGSSRRLTGTNTNDIILGAAESIINAGDGDDLIYNGSFSTTYAGNGNDTVYISKHTVTYRGSNTDGGAGNDTIYSGEGRDGINGGDGDDLLYLGVGEGSDHIDGGTGTDTIDFSRAPGRVDIELKPRPNRLSSIAQAYRPSPTGGTQVQTNHLSNIENANGSYFGDYIYGDNGSNVLKGLAGDDRLHGLLGNDAVYGGTGDDHLIGTYGSDLLDGGPGFDTIQYYTSVESIVINLRNTDWLYDGTHVIPAHTVFEGPSGVDRLVSIEQANGSPQNDYIQGANDIDGKIWASGGDDYIIAGNQSDLVYGGDGNDIITALGGNDEVHGDGGDDIISGSGGNDAIFGGEGNDILRGNTGSDDIWGDAGDDDIRGFEDDDVLYGGEGNDILYGGKTASDLYASNDTLYGDNGNDILWGLKGDDTLDGGAGNDTLQGDEGDDVLYTSQGRDSLRGGTGADRFVLIKDTGVIHIIKDFDPSQGDTLDITDLLINYYPSSSTLTGFFIIREIGSDSYLLVDRDGPGVGYSFEWVVRMQGTTSLGSHTGFVVAY